MSQGRSGTSPTKGGSMPQPSYQNPFGSQDYRQPSSPSKGGQPSFGGPAYQQSGQFGGQIFNRQPMPSPGGKGGQSRPPLEIQPYPMPSPGGKGGSYQRPPTPYGYGQPTFAPQQFAGYGQPSNIFSFNNPHYQPYNPSPIQQPYNPNTGNTGNPMTPTPEVTAQPVDQTAAMRDQIRSLGQEGLQSGAVTRDMLVQAGYANPDEILANANPEQSKPPAEIIQPPPVPQSQTSVPPEPQTRPDPYPIYDRAGGYNPTMPFGGKGGARTAGDELRVFDPYGEGGAYEGQPRPTFPDPTQPQGPQGTVQNPPMSIPNLGGKGGNFRSQLPMQTPPRQDMQPERDPTMPTIDRSREELLAQRLEQARRNYDPQMVSEFSLDPSMVSPALSGSGTAGRDSAMGVANTLQNVFNRSPQPQIWTFLPLTEQSPGLLPTEEEPMDYAKRMIELLRPQTNNSSVQQQGSGIAGLFNAGNLGQQIRSQIPGPPTGTDSVFNNPRYRDLQMQLQNRGMAGQDTSGIQTQLDEMMNNSNDAAYTRQLAQQQGQQRATPAFASNPRLRYMR